MLKPIKEVTAIVIDTGGNYIAIAQRLARDYKKVYYCCNWQDGFPTWNQYAIGLNVPDIERVDHWAEVIDECDLVVIPDLYFGSLADWFVKHGWPVFGARLGENMEIYRDEFKELLEQFNLPVNDYEIIQGFTKLKKYLATHEDKWVKTSIIRGNGETFHWNNSRLSESRLDKLQHTLGAFKEEATFVVESPIPDAIEIGYDGFSIDGKYPEKTLAGIEIKDCGYAGGIIDYKALPEVLKQINKEFSAFFAGAGYKCFFSNEVRWTGKKGYFIDATCFSADTEILTDKGWKFFYELEGTEKVCTINPESRNIEYHKPYNHVAYHFEGEMINIKNQTHTLDLLVTPNHSVWRTDRFKRGLFEERADSLTDKGYIPRIGHWIGVELDFFELPEYIKEWDFVGRNKHEESNRIICKKVHSDVATKINADAWFAFMGWYLSEGSCSKHGVNISQTKNVAHLKKVMDNLGFKYSYREGVGFEIHKQQLRSYLNQFGRCDDKFVPDYIKNASSRQIQIFLENFRLGDGSAERNLYFTTSKQLANDIQELALKIGKVANIRKRKTKGTEAVGLGYNRNFDIYLITIQDKRGDAWFETGNRKNRYLDKQYYKGFVYDVTVKNHIIYVRRNGIPCFSGNCRTPQPPGDLQMEIYKNYSEIIWQAANGMMPEIVPAAKFGTQIIIRSDWALCDPQAVYYPAKYNSRIKLKNLMYKDNLPYFIPGEVEMCEIGSLVGLGETLEAAIADAKKIAETVEGDGISCNGEALDKAAEQIAKLNEYNIKMF